MKKLQGIPELDTKFSLKKVLNNISGSVFGVEIGLRKYYKKKPIISGEKLIATFDQKTIANLIELDYGIYDPNHEEFFLLHDTGLFSCLSTTLWSICDLITMGFIPKKINYKYTLSAYKDTPDINIYSLLFKNLNAEEITENISPLNKLIIKRFDHHGSYGKFNYEQLNIIIKTYFKINSAIHDRINTLSNKYINPKCRYAGICIRGTDKNIEILQTDSSIYIATADKLLAENLIDRIYIQTDQSQIQNLFKQYYKNICDSIDEIPTTNGNIVIHKAPKLLSNRTDFSINMVSSILIIANMQRVITHTGNVGAWIALMRGSASNIWQARPEGIVIQ